MTAHAYFASLSLSLSRYIVFLSPHDIGYSLCLTTPIQLILYMIEEFARAKKVFSGVTMAAAVYPKSLLAMAVVGMLKGDLGLSPSLSLSLSPSPSPSFSHSPSVLGNHVQPNINSISVIIN